MHPKLPSDLLLILLTALCCLTRLASAQTLSTMTYTGVNTYLCIKSQFTVNQPDVLSGAVCATLCSLNLNCLAFSLATGWCQQFVFDKCSKNVRVCNCTTRGLVFFKPRSGLQPGSLCPSGFGDSQCGVKYKMLSGNANWQQARQNCESQGEFVLIADVVDAAEMNYVETLYSKYSAGSDMWLGGYQPPGSAEPSGGFYWVGCNITMDSSLWASGEPDNAGGVETTVGRSVLKPKLVDFADSRVNPRTLCECLAPFD